MSDTSSSLPKWTEPLVYDIPAERELVKEPPTTMQFEYHELLLHETPASIPPEGRLAALNLDETVKQHDLHWDSVNPENSDVPSVNQATNPTCWVM
jgi:hypothetical protein